uniref:AlNc14C133G7033 protein n=1 Tax=Albugo laibachii Nc14 TaxID=890382 RepID=F0WKI3_9STRA|nr:AlNc14C133G7033 [Albugo laibachii Nc14]|eukprot:CCA21787.1 AlNc14C133G7033 [Albugo laibachii Nc14]
MELLCSFRKEGNCKIIWEVEGEEEEEIIEGDPTRKEREKGMIMAFHLAGLGRTEIAHMTGRCAQTIRRVIHPPPTTCKLPGPKPLLPDRDIRCIVHTAAAAAAARGSSTAMLKHELNIFASVGTLQRTLARVDWLGSSDSREHA